MAKLSVESSPVSGGVGSEAYERFCDAICERVIARVNASAPRSDSMLSPADTALVARLKAALGDDALVEADIKVMDKHYRRIELPDWQAGYCYTKVLRSDSVGKYKDILGPTPDAMLAFASFESVDLHVTEAMRLKLYMIGDPRGRVCYHVASAGGQDWVSLGTVAEVLLMLHDRGMLVLAPDVVMQMRSGSRKIKFDFVANACIGIVPEVVLEAPVSLVAQSRMDFTDCFCRLHTQPLSVSERHTVGCSLKPIGTAGPINAAGRLRHGHCAVLEAVRRADKRFLEFVLSGDDPGMLAGAGRPVDFAHLCTSSADAKLTDFGNGYCYLEPMMHDTWWRVARLVGPNPSVAEVATLMLWTGRRRGRLFKCVDVDGKGYHIAVNKASKGEHDDAGLNLYRQLVAILRDKPDAIIL